MSRVCWIFPSGRIVSAKKKEITEEKLQEYAATLPNVIFFYV